jgi:tRNA U55 pseudouridine synthase TruB
MCKLCLVIGVGHGCRKLKRYLEGDKSYVAIGKFGEETDTLNNTGTIINNKPFGMNLHLKE